LRVLRKDKRREAGLAFLAAAVFAHHFGNRKFRELGIDTRSLRVSNFERFKTKWGRQRTAGII